MDHTNEADARTKECGRLPSRWGWGLQVPGGCVHGLEVRSGGLKAVSHHELRVPGITGLKT